MFSNVSVANELTADSMFLLLSQVSSYGGFLTYQSKSFGIPGEGMTLMDRRPDVVLTVRGATLLTPILLLFSVVETQFIYPSHYFCPGPGYDSDPHGTSSPASR